MDNYIVINGKKAELTKEQLKALGIEVEKKRNNPFNSKSETTNILYVTDATHLDGVAPVHEYHDNENWNKCMIERANSFNDKDFANQVYLHELLNRKLLKYAYDNEAEDCEWNGVNLHYYIACDKMAHNRYFASYSNFLKDISTTYFSKKGIASQAIEDMVKPFIKEHPEFVW